MKENKEKNPSPKATQVDPGKQVVEVVKSGLTPAEEGQIYTKIQNQGKCCEGGSEGWTG